MRALTTSVLCLSLLALAACGAEQGGETGTTSPTTVDTQAPEAPGADMPADASADLVTVKFKIDGMS